MDDDAQIQDHTDSTPAGNSDAGNADAAAHPEIPERLRVHSLARVLGTTSRRVLDALIELDGRSRSAHSSVDRVDAVKVRDVLAAADQAVAAPEPVAVPAVETPVVETPAVEEPAAEAPVVETPAPEVVEEALVVEAVSEVDPDAAPEGEPESRLLIETPPQPQDSAADDRPVADYLPLFVAPQPVQARPAVDRADHDDDDDELDAEDSDDADDEQAEKPANRRRRRGRRGRGRGRGGEPGSDSDDDEGVDDKDATDTKDTDTKNADTKDDADSKGKNEASDADDESSDDDEGDDDDSGDGSTRRRRRRRRRKSGAADDGEPKAPDDPPNTVVHERAPRSKAEKAEKVNNEIQGISGSTRLEAKRQRRRDGRDAGRRRPPILSEAEFLARREAVERVMVVRDTVRTEPPHTGARYTQIAVLEDGVVVEHFVTSAASASLVGNIYLGIVQNVLPSMEAAFVDIGRGRNGVLYAGEVNWEAAGLGGSARKIEQALKPGDYVVVQVSKDPVGHKGARLTTQVSLAGRYLVYVPGASSTGISRKLPDTERQRLKEILREVVPSDAGVIIRTASEGVKEEDIRGDVTRLQERWNQIDAKAAETKKKASGAAVALYEEPDVLVKVIRDLFNEDFSNLIVSGDNAWKTINDYVESVAPELMSKLTKYEAGDNGGPDVFAVHRIDEQLTKAMDRKVWLPSGGTLVIDRTEAMTVVDVNTGKFTGAGGNLEQTVTKNNLEAAEEIVRQLRLRDIGGIIVIDFIDMVLESNRDLVLRRLTEALARDRTRHQVSEVTSLGLVQLTRKKLGTGLIEAFSTTCTHCAGRGIVLHTDPVDSGASAPPRKADSNANSGSGSGSGSGGRRGKRSRKGRTEEVEVPEAPAVAKLPPHVVGEHPMFKAMAAATGKHDDESEDGFADELSEDVVHDSVGEERVDEAEIAEQVATEVVAEDLDDEDDFEDPDDEDSDDEDDVEEIDLIDDEDDDDSDDEDSDDDDIDLEDDSDDDDEDSDDDEEDEDSDDAEDDSDEDEPEPVVEVIATARPRRRRAAARPAGPPAG
ncbi:Rne/Rng family ribonuclease [Mycolicibacterium mengxianglii]|uniref:Rne/Rng family ribonuclease n=1 Tax=Mycolicibacterium mengxianglii TaxID=2736649 RepID=UPI0018EED51D|nr:Rne/Rng family ribonuclease [Mycolicibacterium mengxianglii]